MMTLEFRIISVSITSKLEDVIGLPCCCYVSVVHIYHHSLTRTACRPFFNIYNVMDVLFWVRLFACIIQVPLVIKLIINEATS